MRVVRDQARLRDKTLETFLKHFSSKAERYFSKTLETFLKHFLEQDMLGLTVLLSLSVKLWGELNY